MGRRTGAEVEEEHSVFAVREAGESSLRSGAFRGVLTRGRDPDGDGRTAEAGAAGAQDVECEGGARQATEVRVEGGEDLLTRGQFVPTAGRGSRPVSACTSVIRKVSCGVRLPISKYSRSRTVTSSVPLARQVKGPDTMHSLLSAP